MKKRSRSFCQGAEDAKFRRLLGEGFQATALLLERGGAWDLVAVEPPEPEEPPAAEPWTKTGNMSVIEFIPAQKRTAALRE